MLELIKISKTYHVGNVDTIALSEISVCFRKKEFVAILGTSGSGKTTFLNILGGLDRYDSGEMSIRGKNTSQFTEKEWDAYRNNSIGFVFQSYNLINHLSIIDNVELGMTLSGISQEEKRKKSLEVLNKVGLKEHLHKKPNQLSGGQMQRVAIARALSNDPEILLCDEPTGALDSETSIQIMDLIKNISQNRLVIMVTHNPAIAEKYADRIINFKDGKIISDSNPCKPLQSSAGFHLKKTSMSFFTALKLSFNNIKTKKWRAFLTSLASSIGIIGIAVILSLSAGFKKQIDKFQSDALAEFPIILTQTPSHMNSENIKSLKSETKKTSTETAEYAASDKVYLYDSSKSIFNHRNIFTEEYLEYIGKINPKICSSIGYARIVGINMVRKINGKASPVSLFNPMEALKEKANTSSMEGVGLSSYPQQLKKDDQSYLSKNYELMAGKYPDKPTDMVLVVDSKNRINYTILKGLGFLTDNKKSINFDDIVGTEFKIISNNDYYVKTEFGTYLPGDNYEAMYSSKKSIPVTITGVVRKKQNVKIGILAPGIAYSDKLTQLVINSSKDSDIVKEQTDSSKNVITMQNMDKTEKSMFLAYLGGTASPFMIMVYPDNFSDKDAVTAYLDAYNEGKSLDNKIFYTDLAGTMSQMTGGIMRGITIVLLAFASISLVVSLIMISIITYTSVLERTKEIGILRSLGARKKDISRVFDAETCIIGVFSGILGIVIAGLLTIPINKIIYNMTELKGVAQLQILHALLLVLLSTVLTIIGGHIPAKMASKKDAVEALRSE